MRGVSGGVEDGVNGGAGLIEPVAVLRSAGLVVGFVERCPVLDRVTRRRCHGLTRCSSIDVPCKLRRLTRSHENLTIESVAIACAQGIVHQEDTSSIRINIGYTNNKIAIGNVGLDPDFGRDLARDLQRLAQWFGSPGPHLFLFLEGPRGLSRRGRRVH